MTTALQLRRGTTAQHSSFTGAIGEVTVDTSKKTIVVHDGATPGGMPLLPKTMSDGTANGVAYLNGSKVLTTGSALTFDGTNLRLLNSSGAITSRITNISSTGSDYSQVIVEAANGGQYLQNVCYGNGYAYTNVYVSGGYYIGTQTSAPMVFNINNAEQMRLTSTGLGIGTSSPNRTLVVAASSGPNFELKRTGFSGYTYLEDDGTNSTYRSYGATIFQTNGVNERMRIDSSGNVGIGTSSPANYSNQTSLTVNGTNNSRLDMKVGGTDTAGMVASSTAAYVEARTAIPLVFVTNGSERMRIDSSGNLLVGTTSTGYSNTNSLVSSQTGYFVVNHVNGYSTSGTYIGFGYNGSPIGTINQNGTNAVSYNTSSDYRLKENIQPMQNALGVVQQLNPVTYTWKSDGSDGQGFIAHELQAVVPDCVTGEKDAVDEEGNPVYQGIDTSFLVATLTKAIQEQQEQIEQLKAEVAALKGN